MLQGLLAISIIVVLQRIVNMFVVGGVPAGTGEASLVFAQTLIVVHLPTDLAIPFPVLVLADHSRHESPVSRNVHVLRHLRLLRPMVPVACSV